MMRILLTVLLPLIGPVVIYLVWCILMARRQDATGKPPPQITRGGLFFSLLAGGLLMIAVLAFTALTGNYGGDGEYVPPRMEDGRIVPGHYN
tara:strand:+ start:2363 stop:2638 length:276 start_codon:yes stop_codon:yes gene_type:complete